MTLRASITLPLIVLLAACGGSGAQREEGGAGEAEGEVLGGSISDEMLPLDAVKSQSPPLKVSPTAPDDTEEASEEGDLPEATEAGEAAAPATSPGED
jgi:hypothetical protein